MTRNGQKAAPEPDALTSRVSTDGVKGDNAQGAAADSTRVSAAPTPEPSAARAQKVDPETLEIRGRPPQAVRFRREAIATLSVIATVAVAGVTAFALQPQIYSREPAAQTPLPNVLPATDALEHLPNSYAQVPQLGAPLPGDLGRPILRAQQHGSRTGAGAGSGVREHSASLDPAAERRAMETAAQQSALFVQRDRSAEPASTDPDQRGLQPQTADDNAAEPLLAAGAASTGSADDAQVRFFKTLDTRATVNPHTLDTPPPRQARLAAGSVIAASLLTGLNSDLPGMVVAQVTQNVFDSATGKTLMIPQGARLIGSYDSAVTFGQERVLVAWQRLIMPDGRSLQLDNMPATNGGGQAGLSDAVDHQTGRLAKGIVLSALLGVGTELSISGESEIVRALREATQAGTSRAGDQITRRNLDIAPTIRIRPGAPVYLLVRADLVLEPWAVENRR